MQYVYTVQKLVNPLRAFHFYLPPFLSFPCRHLAECPSYHQIPPLSLPLADTRTHNASPLFSPPSLRSGFGWRGEVIGIMERVQLVGGGSTE